MSWKEKFDNLTQSTTSLQKFAVAFFVVVALIGTSLVGGIKYVVTEFKNIQADISEAEMLRIEKALENLDVVTYDELAPSLDSIHRGMILNYVMDTTMHKMALRGQNDIIISMDGLKHTDWIILDRLSDLEGFVKTIDGTTKLSLKEQRLLAWEDSLRSANIIAKQKAEALARRKHLDLITTKHLNEIQKILERNQELLKKNGKTKVIKVKPRKSSKRKTFKERVLVPL